ncbi:MAG: hypothetical protein IIC92_11350 [Chloroflexi bacterium]|nr:hypothetical protein [Chloroflexota bacterium]
MPRSDTASKAATGAGRFSGLADLQPRARMARHIPPLRGQDFIHVAADDHSRFTYVEPLHNENADTTGGFLERAVEAYAAVGVQIEHILTTTIIGDHTPVSIVSLQPQGCR